MAEYVIKVADFTETPGGRWRKDGQYSGEEFRDSILTPTLTTAHETRGTVVILLDGVAGYGSSFLEEVFGGIVRSKLLPPDEIAAILNVRANDAALEGFKADALRYLPLPLERVTFAKLPSMTT
jgi:hypothetical protein